jgi:hypothetical protein
MAENTFESAWNPVKLGSGASHRSGGYQISTTSVSNQWYRRAIEVSGQRKQKLQHYYEMDTTSVEVSRALDVLAEDISSSNADNEDSFLLAFDENRKYLKSTVSLIENAKDIWKERTKMQEELFNRVRNTLKNGLELYEKKPDGRLKRIPSERIIGYITDADDEDIVTHYIVDPFIQKIDDFNHNRQRPASFQKDTKDNYDVYPVDDLLIFKVGDGPYGESVLDCVYKVWRQMSLIESSIVIYRVVRAPEKTVYYIDVGNLQGPKREKAIEKQRLRLMQKQVNRSNQVESEYDPHSASENIFIPTNSQGKGSRVETLQGGSNVGEIRDLEYFVNKLAAGLRIPSSMLDSQTQEKNTYSDMRVGQVYQIEMRYMGHVKRIARYLARKLHDNFVEFSANRGVVVPEGAILSLNDPNSFSKYKDMEIFQQTLNLASSSTQLGSLSRKFVMEKYLLMTEEELIKNENFKLIEMGLAPDVIKGMPGEHIDHLVYAETKNPEIQKKYGLAADDGGGRF